MNYLSLAGRAQPHRRARAARSRSSRSTWWPTTRAPACTARSASCWRCSRASAPGRGQHVDVSYLDTTLSLLAATPNMRFFFSDGLAPQARRGLPGRLVSLLRDLRDAGRQAPDHRLHRALALGELLQGHRPAGLRALRPQARPVRARRQRRGGGGAATRSRPSSGRATATSGTSSWSRPTSAWARSTTSRRWCRTRRSTTAA